MWTHFSLVAAITAESGRPTDMNARAVSIATEGSFTCMQPAVDDFCSVTNRTVLIGRIIGMALLQTKAIQFQILPSMDHLDQNIYAPGVFQIQRYTSDSLEVVKGITNGRLFYSTYHSKSVI